MVTTYVLRAPNKTCFNIGINKIQAKATGHPSLEADTHPELDLSGSTTERVDPDPTPTRSILCPVRVVPLICPAAPGRSNPLSEAAGKSKFAKLNRL